jgi:hypothetical protein
MSNRKFDLCIKLATELVGTPKGGWPQTQQAERQLADALPRNLTREKAIAIAIQQGAHVHPSRATATLTPTRDARK